MDPRIKLAITAMLLVAMTVSGETRTRGKHHTSSSYLDSFKFHDQQKTPSIVGRSSMGHFEDESSGDSEFITDNYYSLDTDAYEGSGFHDGEESSGDYQFPTDDEDRYFSPSSTITSTTSISTTTTTVDFTFEGSGSGDFEDDDEDYDSDYRSIPKVVVPSTPASTTLRPVESDIFVEETSTSTSTTTSTTTKTTSTTSSTTTETKKNGFGPNREKVPTVLVDNKILVVILYASLVVCLFVCILAALCMLMRCSKPPESEVSSDTASSDLPIMKADARRYYNPQIVRSPPSESPPPLPDLNLFDDRPLKDVNRSSRSSLRKSKGDTKSPPRWL